MTNKRRLYELDLMRAWLCNSVMIVHVFGIIIPYYGMEQLGLSTTYAVISALFRLNVPGFIFLGGFFVLYSRKELDIKRFFSTRFKSTLPLYIVFTAIYFAQQGWGLSIRPFLSQLFRGTAKYHLYFIPMILQLYLMTPLLVKLVKAKPRTAVAIGFGLSFAYRVINILTYPLLTNYYWCFPYLAYYVWGLSAGYLAERVKWQKTKLLCFIFGFALSAMLYEGAVHLAAYAAYIPLPSIQYNILLSALDYLRTFLGLCSLQQIWMRASEVIEHHEQQGKRHIGIIKNAADFAAHNSYIIYLAHPLLLTFLNSFIVSNPWRLFFVFPPLMWAITCGIRQLEARVKAAKRMA